MADTWPVRDTHQFCSLCYFHFWRPSRIFHLGRFEDLIADPAQALPQLKVKIPAPQTIVLLGDNYYVAFDRSINSMAWQLLVPGEDRRHHLSRPAIEPETTMSGEPVFPICRDCFWVIKEFLMHRNGRGGVGSRPTITSLDGLYAAIHNQWQRSGKGETVRDQSRWQLRWSHRSFRGPFVAWDRWERPQAATRLYPEQPTTQNVEEWRWLVDNPYRPLPSLPDFLLTHLRPISTANGINCSHDHEDIMASKTLAASNETPTDQASNDMKIDSARVLDDEWNVPSANLDSSATALDTATFPEPPSITSPQPTKANLLLQLPNEILAIISSCLDPSSIFALRLANQRLAAAIPLDQHFWYRALIANRLFGFFFDFDSMKVLEETRRKCQKRGRLPPRWDWKRLVGELARFESFENGGVMADAPGAFRNRRRIWKILEVAEQLAPEYKADSVERGECMGRLDARAMVGA